MKVIKGLEYTTDGWGTRLIFIEISDYGTNKSHIIGSMDNDYICIISTMSRGILDSRIYFQINEENYNEIELMDGEDKIDLDMGGGYELFPEKLEQIPGLVDAIEYHIFGKTESGRSAQILKESDLLLYIK